MANFQEQDPADQGPPEPFWVGSVIGSVLNCLGVLFGIISVAAATSMTNIGGFFLFLPALGVELLVLTPLTMVSCYRERSGAMKAFLLLTLIASICLLLAATHVNLYFGAKW